MLYDRCGSRVTLMFQTVDLLGAVSPEDKVARAEVNHLSPFGAEVKNDGAICPLHISSWHNA
jgi:hypothetical protein